MDFRELQEQHRPWLKRVFPTQTSEETLIGVGEEYGELCHAHLKDNQNIKMSENHFANKVDAVADIVIFLAGYCNLEGISMQNAVELTWEKVKKRNYKKI